MKTANNYAADPDQAQREGVAAQERVVERLRLTLDTLGLRPAPVAAAAGLNESCIRDMFRQRSRNTGIATLARIAAALGVPLETLIQEDGGPFMAALAARLRDAEQRDAA